MIQTMNSKSRLPNMTVWHFHRSNTSVRWLLALLVGSLLVLSSCSQQSVVSGKTPTPSPSQTQVATPTPFIYTPAPTPIPKRDFDTIHMIDAMTGWATTRLYLYTPGGYTLRTTDGGMHWKDVSPRYTLTHNVAEGLATYFLSASTAWLVTSHNDVFRTTDGGQTWQDLSYAIAPSGMLVSQITFIDPQHGWMLFAVTDTPVGHVALGDDIDMFRTTDGGVTWTKVTSTGTSASPNTAPGHLPLGDSSWGISFVNASTGYATYEYPYPGTTQPIQFYSTRDGGFTWSQQTLRTPFPANVFETLSPTFFSANDGILPVMLFTTTNQEGTDFYVTHDGGVTWSSTTLFSATIDISAGLLTATAKVGFTDMNHGWIVSARDDQLYTTSDGAHDWSTISISPSTLTIFYLDFVSSQLGLAIGPLGNDGPYLFRTEDGGYTWTQVPFVVS